MSLKESKDPLKDPSKDSIKNIYAGKNYVNQKYGDYRNSISTVSVGGQQILSNPLNIANSSNMIPTNPAQMTQILSPKYISTKPGLIKSSKYSTNTQKTEQSGN